MQLNGQSPDVHLQHISLSKSWLEYVGQINAESSLLQFLSLNKNVYFSFYASTYAIYPASSIVLVLQALKLWCCFTIELTFDSAKFHFCEVLLHILSYVPFAALE